MRRTPTGGWWPEPRDRVLERNGFPAPGPQRPARGEARAVGSALSFTFMDKVRETAGRGTRISAKNQVTIPVDALRAAGLAAGQRLVARAEGPGRVVLERVEDVVAEFAGVFTGVYRPGELEKLRDEWD